MGRLDRQEGMEESSEGIELETVYSPEDLKRRHPGP